MRHREGDQADGSLLALLYCFVVKSLLNVIYSMKHKSVLDISTSMKIDFLEDKLLLSLK